MPRTAATARSASEQHTLSRKNGHQVSESVSRAKTAHEPTTSSMLSAADPTTVPTPMSEPYMVPISETNSSGAEPPAVMRVAPAMAGEISKR